MSREQWGHGYRQGYEDAKNGVALSDKSRKHIEKDIKLMATILWRRSVAWCKEHCMEIDKISGTVCALTLGQVYWDKDYVLKMCRYIADDPNNEYGDDLYVSGELDKPISKEDYLCFYVFWDNKKKEWSKDESWVRPH